MRRSLQIGLGWLVGLSTAHAAVGARVDGIAVEDGYQIEGNKVVLNGVGLRKRAFFRTDVTAIYLAEKRSTLEGIETLPGAKRIQLTLLRDIPGSIIARYFVSDFEQVATKDEFKQLINEVGAIGSIYGTIHHVSKGDIVNIDWVPGKGITSTLNGRTLTLPGQPPYLNNELMYRIFMRMYVGAKTPEELRANLLGVSRSMRDTEPEKQ